MFGRQFQHNGSPQSDDDDNDDNDDDNNDNDNNDDDTFTCNVEHPDSTVGLLACRPGASEGYTLLAPELGKIVYLLDMYGRVINSWPGDYWPGQVVYLLENGQLLRTGNLLNLSFAGGGIGGQFELQNWDGTVTWQYEYSSDSHCAHHDVRMLPSGNILIIAWEKKSYADAVAAGRVPTPGIENDLWPDAIFELQPVGSDQANFVWEWHAWDHMIQDVDPSKNNYGVVAAHPELFDINYRATEWTDFLHMNTVDYNPAFDEIMLSVREYSEIWVIDHGTTTAEAAGHTGGSRGRGGDLLYRWGNPATYGQSAAGQFFYGQHDAEWIADGLPGAGDVLSFNNGVGRPGGVNYSDVDELAPAVDNAGDYPAPSPAYGPAGLTWSWSMTPETAMYSAVMGGAQRLRNGNTLVCNASDGRIREVTTAGDVVWDYVNPVVLGDQIQKQGSLILGPSNELFRAYRYTPDYPGLAGRDLTPGKCLVEPCE